ncbi:cyanate hydratase [Spinellus fusiger]|nr:cyanate hydratase [Spinellus fusiger]
MNLSSIHKRMLHLKAERNLSFAQIAEEMGRDEVYVAALFYGQAKPTTEELQTLSKSLATTTNYLKEELGEHFFPSRGGLTEMPPKDPTLYRLYEIIEVYGYPIKSVIHERFGDGIMSAVDFSAHVEKVDDPKGDRVRLTLEGKFLPYAKW